MGRLWGELKSNFCVCRSFLEEGGVIGRCGRKGVDDNYRNII